MLILFVSKILILRYYFLLSNFFSKFDKYFIKCFNVSVLIKYFMKQKQIFLNNPDVVLTDLYFSQTNSTLLIGFIGVFMVLISFL